MPLGASMVPSVKWHDDLQLTLASLVGAEGYPSEFLPPGLSEPLWGPDSLLAREPGWVLARSPVGWACL